MALAPRRPLTSETLAALYQAAGLALSAEELAALLVPAAAIYQAIDGLDALGLAGTEPAALFRLPADA